MLGYGTVDVGCHTGQLRISLHCTVGLHQLVLDDDINYLVM